MRKINQEEKALISKCLKKDRFAQKMLYDKYKDAMYTLAYRITGNHEDAQDTLQDTFINVFLNLSKFKGNSTLGAWIKTILVRDAIKKKKIQFPYQDITVVEEESPLKIDENMTGEYIEQAILNLDPGYRTVILLVEIEGYKHHEVSQILNISVGTSKSQFFHARKQLRKKLECIYN